MCVWWGGGGGEVKGVYICIRLVCVCGGGRGGGEGV